MPGPNWALHFMNTSELSSPAEPQQRTLYKLCIVDCDGDISIPSDEELRVTLGAPLLDSLMIESEPEVLPAKQGSIMDLVAKMVEEQGAAFCQHCGVRCAPAGPGASAGRRAAGSRGGTACQQGCVMSVLVCCHLREAGGDA